MIYAASNETKEKESKTSEIFESWVTLKQVHGRKFNEIREIFGADVGTNTLADVEWCPVIQDLKQKCQKGTS